jgi:hypothetical protein
VDQSLDQSLDGQIIHQIFLDVDSGVPDLAPIILKSLQEPPCDRVLWKMWNRYLVPPLGFLEIRQ